MRAQPADCGTQPTARCRLVALTRPVRADGNEAKVGQAVRKFEEATGEHVWITTKARARLPSLSQSTVAERPRHSGVEVSLGLRKVSRGGEAQARGPSPPGRDSQH